MRKYLLIFLLISFCSAGVKIECQQDQTQVYIDKIINEGWNLKTQNKFDEAILKLETALANSYLIKYDKGIGYSSLYLGTIIVNNNVTKAAELCSTALDISKSINDKVLETYSCNLQGRILVLRGDVENALHVYAKAAELSKSINDIYYEIDSLLCILKIISDKGNYGEVDNLVGIISRRVDQVNDNYVKMNTYYMLGNIYINLSDNNKTIRYFNNALTISVKLNDELWKMSILGQLGNCYLKQGEFRKALKTFKEVNEYYLKESNTVNRGMVLVSMGITLINLGNYEEATNVLDESLEILKSSSNSIGYLASLMVLSSLYDKMGEYFKEYNILYEALLLSREINFSVYDSSLLLNLGITCFRLNKPIDSEKYISNALRLIETQDNKNDKALNYFTLAAYHQLTGNYSRAIDFYNKAKNLSEEINNEDMIDSIYSELALLYFKLGDYIKALSYSLRSIDTKALIKPNQKNVVKISFFASLAEAMGYKDKALENHKRALLLSKKIGDKKLELDCLTMIGNYYMRDWKLDIALEYLLEAKNIINSVNDINSEVRLYETLSYCYLSLKIYPAAYEIINKAIELNKTCMNRSNLQWDYSTLGYILIKLQKDSEALNYLILSEQLRESIKAKIKEKDYASNYLFKTTTVIENIINILNRIKTSENRRGAVIEAFKYAEKGKARILSDMLGGERYKLKSNLLKKDIEEINQNYSKISVLEESYKNTNDIEIKRNIMNEIVSIEEKLRSLEIVAYENDANYASVLSFKPLDIEYIQKQIIKDHNVGIIEYYIGEEKTYIFVITIDNISLVELNINNLSLTNKIKSLREPFERIKNGSFILDELNRFDFKLANELYLELISPISSYLKEINRLIIIPHGCLYYMPFEILVKEYDDENVLKSDKSSGPKKPKYLIDDYSISYASSTSVLDNKLYYRGHKSDFRGDLLAFANPLYKADLSIDKDQMINRNMIIRSFGKDLVSLPNSENEVNEIKKYFRNPLIFKGITATEENFINTSPYFPIIHISTHGYLNEYNPLYSGLAFSYNDRINDIDFCSAYEIFNIKMNSDLVVLSACETALGQNIDKIGGEGVEGLSRAFLYAGAKSLVVSLWQAADESTSILMSAFYKNYIEKGMNKADALREAKKYLMDQETKIGINTIHYSSPFFWAPFILIGNSN